MHLPKLALSLALTSVVVVPGAFGQPMGPAVPIPLPANPCAPLPADGNPEIRYLGGGTLRRPFAQAPAGNPGALRLWVAEDGGRVRFSSDGGMTSRHQATPYDVAQMLLDVVFLPDGVTGWAAGRGGRVIKTLDGGTTWTLLHASNPVILAKNGDPGVFWGVRFLPDNTDIGWIAGLWAFSLTQNGGASFEDVQIFRNPGDTVPLDPMDFEFYCLSVEGSLGGGFIGNCGANWETNLPVGTPPGEKLGVVFHTDSNDSRSSLGRRWWITLEKLGSVFNDPWDFDFSDPLNGYLVGGTGNANGSIYSTTNGGDSWNGPEPIDPGASHSSFATLYGVSDLGNGVAVASGYAGNIWVRNSGGTWKDSFVPGYTAPLMGAKGIAGTGDVWVTGSFGFLRHSPNGGQTWEMQNNGEDLVRARDIHFLDRSTGVMVGQPDQIFLSEDGGCTFTRVYPASGGFGPKPHVSSVDFGGASVGVAVGPAGNVLRTSDAGRTWSPFGVTGIQTDHDLREVAHRSGMEYWAVGKQGARAVIMVTTDDGASWTEMAGFPSPSGITLEAITFSTLDRAFVVGHQGGAPRAYLVSGGGTLITNVSPPADPAGAPRALLDVAAGIVQGRRVVYAAGESGTLLVWVGQNGRFEGVTTVYEFNPVTGTVSLQDEVHDFTTVGVAPQAGFVYAGTNNQNHSGVEEDTSTLHLSGYLRKFDGVQWTRIKATTNKNIHAFSFVQEGAEVTGFILGGGGPGGIVLGTLADTELLLTKVQGG